MKLKTISLTLGTILAGAAFMYAAESWESKDASQWSSEDISKILNDSPWAKHVTASAQQGLGQRGGGRRMGGMGGGGLGLPGGGMGGGYPGGGYPGGGGGRGGGGGGYPGNDDGVGAGGGAPRSIDATLRWESALPVQLAEKQRHSGAQLDDDAKKPADDAKAEGAPEKPYVLMLVGLPLPRPRDTDPNAGSDDQDSRYGNRRGGNRSPEAMRQQFLQNTRIVRKNKSALNPSDVRLDPDRGEVSFFFRRDEPIDLDDKEVSFETMIGRMKIEKKFKVKDMVYHGKLAL